MMKVRLMREMKTWMKTNIMLEITMMILGGMNYTEIGTLRMIKK